MLMAYSTVFKVHGGCRRLERSTGRIAFKTLSELLKRRYRTGFQPTDADHLQNKEAKEYREKLSELIRIYR
jgi:hypothetical protein